MTTKHEPATALPWIAHEVNGGIRGMLDAGAPITGGGLAVARAWEYMRTELHGERAAQNAAYIVHACNEYPRLVGVLRHALVSLSGSESARSVARTLIVEFLKDIGEPS